MSQKVDTTDTRVCAQNFTNEGSFLAGRTYKTHQVVKGVSKNTAMTRAAQYLSSNGWGITNTDKELGIINAAQTVTMGEGKTAPLNVSFSPEIGGLKVSMAFSTSGGLSSAAQTVKDEFCKTIEAVAIK